MLQFRQHSKNNHITENMHCMQHIAEDHLSMLKAVKLLQAEQNICISATSVGHINVTQKAKLHLTSNCSVVCIHTQKSSKHFRSYLSNWIYWNLKFVNPCNYLLLKSYTRQIKAMHSYPDDRSVTAHAKSLYVSMYAFCGFLSHFMCQAGCSRLTSVKF